MKPPAPTAFLLCGPSLAGKSSFAAGLADIVDAMIVSADEINRNRGLPFGAQGLPESVWAETLETQLHAVRLAASHHRSVIIDDTLCYRWIRDRFRQEACLVGLQSILLLFPLDLLEAERRRSQLVVTRGRPVLSRERLETHLNQFEWPDDDENPVAVQPHDTPVSWTRRHLGLHRLMP